MSEFSDRPFVAGSLVGLRAFSVDRFGRLRGPSFDQTFTPFENEATCRKSETSMTFQLTRAMEASLLGYSPPRPPAYTYSIPATFLAGVSGFESPATVEIEEKPLSEAALAPVEVPKHTVGSVTCSCGFYAYFDGGNDYKKPDRVTAVIEGYGVCTVGSRGFRASKARLLAIVTPKRLDPAALRLLERNYPAELFYERKRDALADHPLTTGSLPSPDDADFWTRADA